jgi:hypothetical protein
MASLVCELVLLLMLLLWQNIR